MRNIFRAARTTPSDQYLLEKNHAVRAKHTETLLAEVDQKLSRVTRDTTLCTLGIGLVVTALLAFAFMSVMVNVADNTSPLFQWAISIIVPVVVMALIITPTFYDIRQDSVEILNVEKDTIILRMHAVYNDNPVHDEVLVSAKSATKRSFVPLVMTLTITGACLIMSGIGVVNSAALVDPQVDFFDAVPLTLTYMNWWHLALGVVALIGSELLFSIVGSPKLRFHAEVKESLENAGYELVDQYHRISKDDKELLLKKTTDSSSSVDLYKFKFDGTEGVYTNLTRSEREALRENS